MSLDFFAGFSVGIVLSCLVLVVWTVVSDGIHEYRRYGGAKWNL